MKNKTSPHQTTAHRKKPALTLKYTFKNPQLKIEALTHKSHANEQGHDRHNERLEFLGDAVLDLCISDLLMAEYPTADEGDLSKMRACLVNTEDLAELAQELKLDQDIKLGSSEKRDQQHGHLKPRLLAGVVEALIGAVYLDGGYAKVKKAIERIMGQKVKQGPVNRDYKSILQEFMQKKFQKTPHYTLVKITGKPHEKQFVMQAGLEKKILGQGTGRSKKQATQSAALSALKHLKVTPYTQLKDL